MELFQYQVDAFADRLFAGNPAAVVPLEAWLPDALMQAIAAENNLSETAFLVPEGGGWGLRWFTPLAEVDLCGHATLASAHVLYRHRGVDLPELAFATRSGTLRVRRDGDGYLMDFPARRPRPVAVPPGLAAAVGATPNEVLMDGDLLAVFEDEATVRALAPDTAALLALPGRGLVVTAPGQRHDFVSRFFVPRVGVPEDPVTGSAHCLLAPYWAARLGRDALRAFQCSRRGGEVGCTVRGDRVLLSGTARTFMTATLHLDPPDRTG